MNLSNLLKSSKLFRDKDDAVCCIMILQTDSNKDGKNEMRFINNHMQLEKNSFKLVG